MNKRPLLTKQQFFLVSFSFFTIFVVLSLMSIATGDFAPLQTSEVTRVGVCTQQSSLTMEKSIPPNVETLYICGELTGVTKRGFSIVLFHNDKHVFSTSNNWPSGMFFVPVRATELRDVETNVFLAGTYRIGIRYSNPIALETTFEVVKN